jgi:hypothetical protein
LDIIRLLIDSGVNTAIYDRDEKAFLHQAIDLLGRNAFERLLDHLNQFESVDFEKIFSYLYKEDLDPILYCFKIKSFDKAEILLNFHPEYFEVNFTSEDADDAKNFLAFMDTYTPDEKHHLLELFKKFEVDQNTDLIDFLRLEENSLNNVAQP